MIVYNMRYKGPLEYDKFILNTLQFHNEVNDVFIKEFNNAANTKSFNNLASSLDDLYRVHTGTSDKLGYSKELYLELLEYREV